MNIEQLHFGLSTVLSIVFGTGGALGVFFLTKGHVALLKQKVEQLEIENKIVNKRVDAVKEEIKDAEKFMQAVQLDIQKMENRIIREIHELWKKQKE